MTHYLKPASILLCLLTLLTGVIYPLFITVLAQTLFPDKANGSLIKNQAGKLIGSELIGQTFSQPQNFWSRPSATVPYSYNAADSRGSNLGPTNPVLIATVSARIQTLKKADSSNNAAIPVDLVTASASGLDPHISLAAADYQIKRIAKARNISQAKLHELVNTYTEGRQWGLFGEPRVNVLKLNVALSELRR